MNEGAIDTLSIAQRLQKAGFGGEQAEAVTFAIRDGLTGSLADKEDVAHLDGKITALRGEIKEDIADLRGEMKEDIAHLDSKITALDGKIETTATELRGEMKEDTARLEGKISEIRTELKYIRWIGAVIIVGVLIPLIRDFLL